MKNTKLDPSVVHIMIQPSGCGVIRLVVWGVSEKLGNTNEYDRL